MPLPKRVVYRLRYSLWLVPLLCLLAGILLSTITIAIDRSHPGLVPQTLTGNAMSARMVLNTIASSMMTLITLVLTVTTVSVQLAMAQFSPRIVRALLHDRSSQLSHGLFVATFTYALLAIREVENADEGTAKVPGVTVTVAYVLVLASILTLILYVNHAAQGLRVDGLIDLVGDELRVQVDRQYPAPEAAAADPHVVLGARPGVVIGWETAALVEAARRAGCSLELVPAMGDFVPVGSVLFRAHGGQVPPGVSRLVVLSSERTHTSDPAYGFRKLVDIAERAISSPFGDPTTAVQAIDRLHDCLRQLAPRPIPTGEFRDAAGVVRLVVKALSWDGYVRLAFDELRLAGAPSPQVARRLRAALEDLRSIASPERHPALERQLGLLDAGIGRGYQDDEDRVTARVPDQQGIGSGPDVVVTAEVRP